MYNLLNKRLDKLEERTAQREVMPQGFFYDLWRAYGDPNSLPPGPVNMTVKELKQMLSDALDKAYGKDRPKGKRSGATFRVKI